MRRVLCAASAIAAILLSGCAASIAYRDDYVPDKPVADSERIIGRVLIYTTQADDERVITAMAADVGWPTQPLRTPIGLMTRAIAMKVLSNDATDGADSSHDLANASRYALILRPQARDFRHGYAQPSLAMTPQIRMTLRMAIIDAAGKELIAKDYDSGAVSGESYMVSGKPNQRISKLAHEVMYDLMRRAAAEVHAYQQTHRPATTSN